MTLNDESGKGSGEQPGPSIEIIVREAAAALLREAGTSHKHAHRVAAAANYETHLETILSRLRRLADHSDPDHPYRMLPVQPELENSADAQAGRTPTPARRKRGRPPSVDYRDQLVIGRLADIWKLTVGVYPGSSRNSFTHKDIGAFSRWVLCVLPMLCPSHPILKKHQEAPVKDALLWLRRQSSRPLVGQGPLPIPNLTGLFHDFEVGEGEEELDVEEWENPRELILTYRDSAGNICTTTKDQTPVRIVGTPTTEVNNDAKDQQHEA